MTVPSIDVRSHSLPTSHLDVLAELGADPVSEDGLLAPAWSADAHPCNMEEADREFYILSIPASQIHRGDDAMAVRLA